MKQMSLVAASGFASHGKVTKRAQFLEEMNRVVGGIPLVVEGSDGGRFTDYATFVS